METWILLEIKPLKVSFTDCLCFCLPGSIPSWNWPNLCPAWRHWSWQPKMRWRVTANILPQPSSFFVCLYFTNLYNIWNCYTLGGREGVFVGVGNVCKREETLIQKTPRIHCGDSRDPCLGSRRNWGLNLLAFVGFFYSDFCFPDSPEIPLAVPGALRGFNDFAVTAPIVPSGYFQYLNDRFKLSESSTNFTCWSLCLSSSSPLPAFPVGSSQWPDSRQVWWMWRYILPLISFLD